MKDILPTEKGKKLEFSHFPDPLCAFVYRNWGIIPAATMAKTVEATEDGICRLAADMGLPPAEPDPRTLACGYLTVIRANWHLLDYEQLCTLLGWSEEKLTYVIREEDFFGEKLGGFKPDTGKLLWHDFDRSSLEPIRRATIDFYDRLPAKTASLFDFVKSFEKAAVGGVGSASFHDARFEDRIVYPYCALYGDTFLSDTDFSFPDELLEAYRAVGVNGIWCQAVLYTLAPFPFDRSLSEHYEMRLANMKALTERMAKFGLKLYLYLNEPRSMPISFFETHPGLKGAVHGDYASLCTSVPEVQHYIKDAVATITRSVPLLGGFFTVVASENRTNCYSHYEDGQTDCPRCRHRRRADVLAEVNELIREGVSSVNPSVKVIAWNWGMYGELPAEFTDALPTDVAVMGVSEQAVEKTVGGVVTRVIDYSISVVGPGNFAREIWRRAARRGQKRYAKCQFNNTWECSFVPFLPAFRQVYTHMKGLCREQVNGIFLSWTLGGFPSVTLRILSPMFDRGEIPSLRSLYERVFPAEAVDIVERAGEYFSNAFDNFPFDLQVAYLAPQNYGPACLLFEKPTGCKATMIGYPYDDLDSWRSIYPEDVFENQFLLLSDGWERGNRLLGELPVKSSALDELIDCAEAAYCHFRSTYLQIRFVRVRDGREKGDLAEIAEEEASLALRLAAVQRHNPCIGYESSNHYFYNTALLAEKYINCRYLSDRMRRGGSLSGEKQQRRGEPITAPRLNQ